MFDSFDSLSGFNFKPLDVDKTILAYYSMNSNNNYTLTTGKISTLKDISINKKDLLQSVAADRPIVETFTSGGEAIRFTTGTEYLFVDDNVIGKLPELKTATFGIDIFFEVVTLGLNQTLVSWTLPGSNNPALTIGLATTNKIRIQRRDNTSTVKTNDLTDPTLSALTGYSLSVYFYNQLMSVWLDGKLISEDTDYVTGTSDFTLGRFAIGCRALNTLGLPFDGRIKALRLWKDT